MTPFAIGSTFEWTIIGLHFVLWAIALCVIVANAIQSFRDWRERRARRGIPFRSWRARERDAKRKRAKRRGR